MMVANRKTVARRTGAAIGEALIAAGLEPRLARLLEDMPHRTMTVEPRRPFREPGVPRDEVSLDGRNPPPGIPPGVAGVSTSKLVLREAVARPVVGEFNGERILGRLWPAVDNHLVTLELHY